MKQEIIDKLNLKVVQGFYFGMSFVYDIKTYEFMENVFCALADTDGTPSEKGLVLFFVPKVGFTKISEKFILNSPKSEIEKIISNIKKPDVETPGETLKTVC